MQGGKERVVVLGASNKPERYSYKAVESLKSRGHEVMPVNPALKEVLGIKAVNRLGDIKGRVDTVTLYVGPERLRPMIGAVIKLKPGRIIANPGTETPEMKEAAGKAGVEYIEACTLVMLSTGQF